MTLTPTDTATVMAAIADLTTMHMQLEVIRARFAGTTKALAIAVAMVHMERANNALQDIPS